MIGMIKQMLRIAGVIAVCTFPLLAQSETVSLDTAAHKAGSAGSSSINDSAKDSTQAVRQDADSAVEKPIPVHTAEAKRNDTITPGLPDTGSAPAVDLQRINPGVSANASPISCPACVSAGFSDPGFAQNFLIGPNYKLPEGSVFLLGGSEMWFVKKQLSKTLHFGASGGPANRSYLAEPSRYISRSLNATEDRIEDSLGIYAYQYNSSSGYG